MSFNFEKFKSDIYESFADKFSKKEVDELLHIEEGYSKDTPFSSGRSLLITSLHFEGAKSDGKPIYYSQKVYAGINIWIADNFKGKSSIFKIIQLALTGSDKLKHDIRKWLKHVLVTIKIGDKDYSIYLDMSSRVLKGKVYGIKINSLSSVETLAAMPIINESGASNYEKTIGDFFFNQFSYYSLKWTQKSPRKEDNSLLESNARWKTYFKSIFLESRDSSTMYGAQEKKIFQMLLGLELTYPINRLTVRRDFLKFDKGKLSSLEDEQKSDQEDQKVKFESEKDELETSLKKIDSKTRGNLNIEELYKEYDLIINQINQESARILSVQDQLRIKKSNLYQINSQAESLDHARKRIRKECIKVFKKTADLKEYIEIGFFFSNLDIRFCPSCDHEVAKQKKGNNEMICHLCHETVEKTEELLTQESFLDKIEENKSIQEKLELEEKELDLRIKKINEVYHDENNTIKKLEEELDNSTDLSSLKKRLHEIEGIINLERQKAMSWEQEKYKLISQKAVVEFQLQQLLKSPEHELDNKLEKKIELLNFAVDQLNSARYSIGKQILEKFSSLMLSQLGAFGLSSITDIEISENLDIKYKQDDDFVSFDEIVEGEQLRVKIAFYLSLIQLDIEHNFGKHTRFLIIDSPSKEEGDHTYLEGLSAVLRLIESKFGDKLQILIGTAERTLSGSSKHEIIIPKSEFLF